MTPAGGAPSLASALMGGAAMKKSMSSPALNLFSPPMGGDKKIQRLTTYEEVQDSEEEEEEEDSY